MSDEGLNPHWNGLKRGAMKRKTRLNPVSKMKHRRQARNIPKAVKDALHERSGGRCEALYFIRQPDGGFGTVRCPRHADDDHHVLPRSRGGKHTLDNLLHLCGFPHHAMCKDNPPEARAIGILK